MKTKNNAIIITVFFFGIFIGAIANVILLPAREIIQQSFGVSNSIGILMITIYLLFFAISIPIIKLVAKKYGIKKTFILTIALFAIGSFLCGLSRFYGGFIIFMLFRMIQAIGAGGIISIAYTEIRKSFPEDKKRRALGIAAIVYGVATIIGPIVGSVIFYITNNTAWDMLFYINLPICIIMLLLSICLKESASGSNEPIFLTIKNSMKKTISSINLLKDRQTTIISVLAMIVGMSFIGIFMVSQYTENVLKMKVGSGGYYTGFVALFAGIVMLISSKLINKRNVKFIMMIGFAFITMGALVLGLYATVYLNFISVIIGLAFMGIGFGLTMVTLLKYLVLQQVHKDGDPSLMTTTGIFCSFGVVISSILIGFVSQAVTNLQPYLTGLFSQILPKVNENSGLVFSSIQNADITTVVDKLQIVMGQIVAPNLMQKTVNEVEGFRVIIEKSFQTAINGGYKNMFVAIAIISIAGLVVVWFLKLKKNIDDTTLDSKSETVNEEV